MTNRTTGLWTDRLIELRRTLQKAVMAAIEIKDGMPAVLRDGVLEEAIYKPIVEACDTCNQAIGRMIAFAEPAPASTEPARLESDEDRRDRTLIEEWHDVLYDVKCERAIRRLRESMPEPIPMAAIISAMMHVWDECGADDKIEMLCDAVGIFPENLGEHTLFAPDESNGAK